LGTYKKRPAHPLSREKGNQAPDFRKGTKENTGPKQGGGVLNGKGKKKKKKKIKTRGPTETRPEGHFVPLSCGDQG